MKWPQEGTSGRIVDEASHAIAPLNEYPKLITTELANTSAVLDHSIRQTTQMLKNNAPEAMDVPGMVLDTLNPLATNDR